MGCSLLLVGCGKMGGALLDGWLAARTVGMALPVAALVCAYTFRQLLTVMAVTPGGLGVTEVGTAGVLVLLFGNTLAAGYAFTVLPESLAMTLMVVRWAPTMMAM